MDFDARQAKLLPPGSHLTIAPGLRLEARKHQKTFVYRFKSPATGQMKQVKIGEWPAMSPIAAAAAWEKLRARRDAGEELVQPKRAASRAPVDTVREVCNLYLTGHIERKRKRKGANEVRRIFETMLGDFAGMRADRLTRADAFALIERFTHIPVQAKKLRSELAGAWDYALDAGRLGAGAVNWWRLIMRGKLKSTGKKIQGKRAPDRRVLAPEEVGELIRWLPNLSRLVEDALTLYLWTGTRGAEIMAMEASEVSEAGGRLTWTIPKGKTKNARHEFAMDLRVPLMGRAATVVRRRLALHPDGHLFPSIGIYGHTEQKTIQTAVHYHQPYSQTRPEDPRPRLPVTHWSPHDLRRTVRTMLSKMGCPRDVAEAVLGHMKPGIVDIYDRHDFFDERVEWLTRLNVRLEELAAD